MEQFCLNIKKDVIQAIKVPFSEAPQRLKIELAIRLYEKGLISFGKARELSEMTRWAFHDLLGIEGILRRYDVEELEEDLKTLEELQSRGTPVSRNSSLEEISVSAKYSSTER